MSRGIARHAAVTFAAAVVGMTALAGCGPQPTGPTGPSCNQSKLFGAQTSPSSYIWNDDYGPDVNMTFYRDSSCKDAIATPKAATTASTAIAPPSGYTSWLDVPGNTIDFAALSQLPEHQAALGACAATLGLSDRAALYTPWGTPQFWAVRATAEPDAAIIGTLTTSYIPAMSADPVPNDLWVCAVMDIDGVHQLLPDPA